MRLMTVTDSEIIDAIGFSVDGDVSARGKFGTLGVVFKSSPSDVYNYSVVLAETFAALVSADSIGKEFHERFKKTKYPFTKSTRPTLAK